MVGGKDQSGPLDSLDESWGGREAGGDGSEDERRDRRASGPPPTSSGVPGESREAGGLSPALAGASLAGLRRYYVERQARIKAIERRIAEATERRDRLRSQAPIARQAGKDDLAQRAEDEANRLDREIGDLQTERLRIEAELPQVVRHINERSATEGLDEVRRELDGYSRAFGVREEDTLPDPGPDLRAEFLDLLRDDGDDSTDD